MTIPEIELTVQYLEQDLTKFLTDYEAHKLGYDTALKNIFLSLNIQTVIRYCVQNKIDIVVPLLQIFGLLENVVADIPPYSNLTIYTENAILSDINKNTLNAYLTVIDELSDNCKIKCFTMLSRENLNIVFINNIDVPTKYINDEIKLLYTRWRITKPKALDYLISLNDSLFVFKNYAVLKTPVVEEYLMKNITMFNDNTVKNLVSQNIPISVIYKYHKDRAFKYILDYVVTITDLKMILKDLPNDVSLEVVSMLYDRFPKYKEVIDHYMIIKIKEP